MPSFIVTLLLFGVMAPALAAPAQVRLLQAPAWRIQQGTRTALLPGEALTAGDRIQTGAGARVVLALSEGSIVKLGEHAELTLSELQAPATDAGVFKGFLDVVRGAFRFTTTVVGRQREIRARVGSATIGIRGTDVWGKHEAARDFVVLLEGRIEIEHNGQKVTMHEPQSLFMAPAGQAALPLAPVNADDLGRWAQETEPQAGGGQRDEQGVYQLMLPLLSDAAEARSIESRLVAAGHAVAVTEVVLGGGHAWRLSLAGYTTEVEAQAGARAVAKLYAGGRPWVSRQSAASVPVGATDQTP